MASIPFDLVARDKTAGAFRSLGGRLGSIGPKAAIAGAAVGGIAVAGIAAGKALFNIGSRFEAATNIIRKETGASGMALEGLVSSARTVGTRVTQPIEEVGATLSTLNTLLGTTGDELEMQTKSILDYSRAWGVDANTAASEVSKTLNAFGESNVDEFLDNLTVVSQNTGLSVEALTGNLRTYGPVLANAGFTTQEATGFFGALNTAGIDASRVMPGVNAALRNLADQGVTDLRGALIDGVLEIKNATSQTDALNKATELFGAEGAQRMLTAIQSGALGVEDFVSELAGEGEGGLIGAMNRSTGEAAKLAAENLTLGDKFQILKNRAIDAIEPIATKVVEWANVVFDKLLPILENLFMYIQDTLIPLLKERFEPIMMNMGTVVEDVQIVWEKVWPFIRVLFEQVIGQILIRIETFFKIFSGIWKLLAGILTGDWEKAWNAIKDIGQAIWDGLRDSIQLLWDSIVKIFAAAGIDLPKIMRNLGNRILQIIEKMVNGSIDIINGMIGALEAIPNGIIKGINAIIGLINSIPSISIPPIRVSILGVSKTLFGGAEIGIPYINPLPEDAVSFGRVGRVSLPVITPPTGQSANRVANYRSSSAGLLNQGAQQVYNQTVNVNLNGNVNTTQSNFNDTVADAVNSGIRRGTILSQGNA